MEMHRKVVTEYFKLYVLLNKANRHRDEKTSLEFTFVETEKDIIILIAYLEGSSENARIQLALWNGNESWNSAGYSGLHFLEDYIVDVLLNNHKNMGLKLKRKPSEEHLKILLNLIYKNLRSLGIKK
jgi:hypothetical protein